LDSEVNGELIRRHKAAATTVAGILVAVVLLSVVSFLGRDYFKQQQNPTLDIALRIAILMLGLGAVVLRRTRFSTMRLQDIGALQGSTGLLATLEKTTIQLALMGAAIAVLGFVDTLVTENDYWAGLIAVVVLLYCYPTRKSWFRTVQLFANPASEPNASPAS
jgi:hypothetical protein